MKSGAYWTIAIVLMGFGYLAIFSIGAPFLLIGLTMAVLFPFRERRGVLATGIAADLGFVAGYILVGPLGCATSAFSTVGAEVSAGHTSCTNIIGLTYAGGASYNPSLVPALIAGLVLAAIAGAAVLGWSRRHRREAEIPGVRARKQ